MEAITYTLIWSATADWLEVAERQGFEVDWDSDPCSSEEQEELLRLADENPEDQEAGVAVIRQPRDCDTSLKAGDLVLTTGPGGDVYFFRKD